MGSTRSRVVKFGSLVEGGQKLHPRQKSTIYSGPGGTICNHSHIAMRQGQEHSPNLRLVEVVEAVPLENRSVQACAHFSYYVTFR